MAIAYRFMLVFSLTLVVVVLDSGWFNRSILSASALVLLAGFLAGTGVMGWMPLDAEMTFVAEPARFALLSILFTDGMKITARDLAQAFRPTGLYFASTSSRRARP
jgi:NhaP-type Na+/H+ or K+/H+ antiporter